MQQNHWERGKVRDAGRRDAGIDAEYHQTTWCAEETIAFIEANATFEDPWLISVNTFDPPVDYLERYLDKLKDIPLPNYVPGELEDKPLFQKACQRGAYNAPGNFAFEEMVDDDHRMVRAAYWAMVDLIDVQVGRMVAALERSGQLENTLIIFTSDHVEMLGDHGFYLKGPFFYDPAIRVPFIVSWPAGIPGGRRSGALVEAVDIAPTLLEIAGVPRGPGMQGKSLWPILAGGGDMNHHRDFVYSEYYNSSVMFREPRANMTMVRSERYKLVSVHGMDAGELYDLENDANETHNLWNAPEAQAIKVGMLKHLSDAMAWTVDPLPERPAAKVSADGGMEF